MYFTIFKGKNEKTLKKLLEELKSAIPKIGSNFLGRETYYSS